MDEYDELYGIEDDFEQQFADDLEALAEMDYEPPPPARVSGFRTKPQSFEEAIAAGDALLKRRGGAQPSGPLGAPGGSAAAPEAPPAEDGFPAERPPAGAEQLTPQPKRRRREAVKKLQFTQTGGGEPEDDISPPSSPEDYSTFRRSRVQAESRQALDISGLAELQETPRREPRGPERHVLHRPPPSGDYISVTDSSGNRVYLAMKDEDSRAVDTQSLRRSQWSLGLLSVPIEQLREQVAEKRHRQLVEESQRLSELLNSRIDQEFGELDGEEQVKETEGEGEEEEEERGDEEKDSSSSRLWVDRFSPRHFTDLLSDDYTNRCLLKWLKLWDAVVFGREKPVKKAKPAADGKQSLSGRWQQGEQQNQRFKTKAQITEEILEAELDQYKRPKYKVALLCGPPGLGKTTLAHVIAKHAGYNVVEMNASDDRSPELFQKRIDTATQMKSVLGADEKPNCLVIDEIDGAPSAAINVLLATLNRKESREEEAGAEGAPSSLGKSKRKKKESVLLRPIICICNDLYVPALRQLRQQAFLLAFPPTQPSRLVQRLTEISKRQGMKADTGALMALCEKTDNDIRSCINTLQFLHGRGRRQLDQRMVQSMTVGLKDQNKGLFSVWQEIFQLPRVKRKRAGQELSMGLEEGSGPGNASTQRLTHILHLVSSAGEHEKLAQGLYDNFLNMKLKDPSLRGICAGLEWLGFTDLLAETMMHGQNFSLMRYLPFLPAAFHLLYAANNVPRIAYPNSQYEAQARTQQTKNVLTAMLADIHPAIRSRTGLHVLSLDILSLLLDVICPRLRPVNPQLYSARERQQLLELIDTMLSYNLTYLQSRTPEGQYIYALEPNMEEVVRFPTLPPRRQLTYQAKQMIAREIELEKMRRAEAMLQARNPQREEEKGQGGKRVPPQGPAPKEGIKNHQQRLESIVKQAAVETAKPEVDFFGRAITIKEKLVSTTATAEPGKGAAEPRIGKAVGSSDVWFRFNEGVSNAVRRNVYIKDLL